MNGEVLDVDCIDVEQHQVKEVLKVLLHSIIVQRALGEFQYSHADSELFELSYARCDSPPVASCAPAWLGLDAIPASPAIETSAVMVSARRVAPADFDRCRERPTARSISRRVRRAGLEPARPSDTRT